jgi:hypothetical protein
MKVLSEKNHYLVNWANPFVIQLPPGYLNSYIKWTKATYCGDSGDSINCNITNHKINENTVYNNHIAYNH